MNRAVFIGFDPREIAAFAVAKYSVRRRLSLPIPVRGLTLSHLRDVGLYTRPIETQAGPAGTPIMWDVISDAAMATEHACARFLVRELVSHWSDGWVMFADGDVLIRSNLCRLFDDLDESKALFCVKHPAEIADLSGVKMDGQTQAPYARKLWSSLFLLNIGHPSNRALTPALVNSVPGRDLHRFCWLNDHEIGELDPTWNHLVGVAPPRADAKIAHFTLGVPDMPGHEDCEYSAEWRRELNLWAAS